MSESPSPDPPVGAAPPGAPLPSDIVRAHVRVWGRVQGIGFRLGVSYQAKLRWVSGWVRNSGDDQVECVLEGPRVSVEAVITWCRLGPPGAQISDVQVEWGPPTGEEGAVFQVRHSK